MSEEQPETRRPLEVSIAACAAPGTTDAEARRRGASAADAVLAVVRRDAPDGAPRYFVTSADRDGAPLSVEELFRVWVSLAETVLHADEHDQSAQARRRFCKWTLERLGLDESLQRLARVRAEHPGLTEAEAVQRMRVEAGAAPST